MTPHPSPQLSAETLAAFLQENPRLAGPVDPLRITEVTEVGDGNLNLVFIVRDAAQNSVVVKQSLPHVRTDPSWEMTRERTRREATVLREHHRFDAAHVPAPFGFSSEHSALALEDLSDHAVWRTELNAGRVHPYAAAELGAHIATVAFRTSVFGMPTVERQRLIAETANPELSEITEQLVFTEPYIDHPHNAWLPANDADVAELRTDHRFVREVTLAKIRFQEHAQSLLHGDLHTGSVFVRAAGGGGGSVRAFDAEFGTYGPTGFDLGAVWGNLLIAAARSAVLGHTENRDELVQLPAQLWASFEHRFRELWPERIEPQLHGAEVLEFTLERIASDAAIFAAAKATRRMFGFARVSDIETIPEAERADAVSLVLRAARRLGTERLQTGAVDQLVAGSAYELSRAHR